MLIDIAKLNFEPLLVQLYIVFICWVIVLLAVAIDFYFGVKKSKERGKPYIHSYGIKKSGKKLAQYLAIMMFMFFLDVINPFWVYSSFQSLPIFSIAGCAIWVWTERKSVLENFEDKVRHDFEDNAKDLMKTLNDIRQDVKSVTSDLADIKDNERRINNKE